ncbi:hypothetical protein POSPLDRAFT_107258 [Postia placenta Mad-698-R]|nr:hypothetical protein POSPLDRAFT_107258 [Postia placenta Mad-698-R]
MRFNDGFWLLKNGVKAHHGLQVVQATQDGDGYNLQVSTKPIRHRGDTLAGPVLSVRVHSPTEGVIGVRIDHFRHIDPTPNFSLFPDDPPVPSATLTKRDASWSLATGDLSAEIAENPYTITFRSPSRVLTSAGFKHQGIYDLNLSPGELVYGLGEQFGAFVKNGQSVSVWNQDGGTSSEQAYKCVPFYITNRNYGVFINHPGEVEVEVGSEKVSRVGVSVAGESLEFFVIYGPTPLEILERYTRMTGRPALLPSWTFGLWLSTSFLTSYDDKTVSSFLQGMQDRNCPVRVFHLDCFWMKQYEWCSFTFDPDNFPNPRGYLSDIKRKYDVKICVWSTDFGERIPHASVVFHDGSDPMRMHNAYAVIYNEMVFRVLERRFGKGEAVVFARSASAGGQRYHWGGDCESTFEAMAETLRGGLSLTTSGFAFTSHDIGGFEGHPPPEIYHRWVAYGLFSSHSRLHGSMSYRVPWHYGEEAAAYMARFLDAKHRLMPYLYNLALKARTHGHPLQRAMFIEFPSDRTTHTLDRQYMLGPSLLVAPVFVPQGEDTEYYVPAGRWTSFFHPQRFIQGPIWVQEAIPLDEIPVWVRPGTILCLGPRGVGRPDYDYAKGLDVQLYELEDGQKVETEVPTGTGTEIAGIITAEKRGGQEVRVKVEKGERVVSLRL